MLSMIMPFLVDMEKRAIPPYQLFLKQQAQIILERYNRLQGSSGGENRATAMLRYILNFMDLEYMLKQPNNYTRYLYHLRFVKKSIDESFDRVTRGRGYNGTFISKSSCYTEEFILPADDTNVITNLPLETDDWNIWKKVTAIKLVGHDSPEYTVNMLLDRLTFNEIPPNYTFIMIDSIALMLKYYSWYVHGRESEINQEMAIHAPQQLFLHKYVMCDLIWDNLNVWLLNTISRLSDYVNAEGTSNIDKEFNAKALETDMQWGRLATQATDAFKYLGKLLGDTSKNTRPEAILSSKLLLSGSILDYANRLVSRWDMPILEQYDYLKWIRDRQLFNFILSIYLNRPTLPTSRRLIMNVRRDYKRLVNHRPWRICNNVLLKNDMQDDMEETLTKLFSI